MIDLLAINKECERRSLRAVALFSPLAHLPDDVCANEAWPEVERRIDLELERERAIEHATDADAFREHARTLIDRPRILIEQGL